VYYVIGSGLAGIMCAHGLLEEGASVTLIDVGTECEPDKLEIVRKLSAVDPEKWDPALVESIKGDFLSSRSRRAFKPVYGSDFPYATNELEKIAQTGTRCLLSHAKGGLSNVWGAAVLPNRDEDFDGWPIRLKDLASSYEAVARVMKIAGRKDDLEKLYPYYSPPSPAASLSAQAQTILGNLNRDKTALDSAGIFFGQSRLAIRTIPDENGRQCENVGLCLSGCPYSAIYNATQTLTALAKNPNFHYLPGLAVEKLEELPSGEVRVSCRSVKDSGSKVFSADRVFVACGVLSTVKLIVNSSKATSVDLDMKYQPYFLMPFMMFKNHPDAPIERRHTLAQIFVDIFDSTISRHAVHLQFYTYNDIFKESLRRTLRLLPFFKSALEARLTGRLIAVQGYMHSDEAAGIRIKGRADSRGEMRLELSGEVGSGTKRTLRRLILKLIGHSRAIGAFPLLPLAEIGQPGQGNHIGAVFPMKENPGEWESDSLGRVGRFKRIHVVDASVLTTLPATTISYTSMANAHRIAVQAARQDAGI
jgi:choline dehydrogenase-like flavoprotein